MIYECVFFPSVDKSCNTLEMCSFIHSFIGFSFICVAAVRIVIYTLIKVRYKTTNIPTNKYNIYRKWLYFPFRVVGLETFYSKRFHLKISLMESNYARRYHQIRLWKTTEHIYTHTQSWLEMKFIYFAKFWGGITELLNFVHDVYHGTFHWWLYFNFTELSRTFLLLPFSFFLESTHDKENVMKATIECATFRLQPNVKRKLNISSSFVELGINNQLKFRCFFFRRII